MKTKKTKNKNKKRIFLDYASITPLDNRVEKVMQETQKKFWSNSSSLHKEGEEAKNILEEARRDIAHILHCKGEEVIFVSGGTESANLAIMGVIEQAKIDGINPHIITSTIEHPAVLNCIKKLAKWGVEVSYISPRPNGIINPESIKKELKENTVLVAIQHANNEIGTIQPIHKISTIIKEFKSSNLRLAPSYPYLYVDACQSVLYEDVSIERLGADLLSIDGIKMYGPRGVGVLVVKRNVKLQPIILGGGQEKGLRSGTENVANAVGLSEALKIANKMREKEVKSLTLLRNYAIIKILKEIPGSILNGDLRERLPNNINICFATPEPHQVRVKAGFATPESNGNETKVGLDSEFLVIKLDTLGFAVSAASACQTLSLENSSYVIESLGPSNSSGQAIKDCGSSSLRFTLGRDSKKSDIDSLVFALKKILK